jgi:hypothetical protein
MSTDGAGRRDPDPGARLILKEIRDLRVEMRRDAEERRRADEAWREERRLADEAWREERRRVDEERRQDLERSDARFRDLLGEFREDSARREAVTQRAFRDVRSVGLSIVRTLNLHTRILERIDGKLGARPPWLPGQDNGRA